MSIRFLLGKAGTGKSGRTIDEIKQKLIDDPKGAPIFYIVPDQMTFQLEYELFRDGEIHGSTRAHVVSFSRLAYRVLQDTGGATKQFISSIGIQMMLRKIVEDKQTDFQMFQKAMEKQGFLHQLEKMITEFKRYQISPEMLEIEIDQMNQFVHKNPGETSLIHKLKDLGYVYEKLTAILKGKYIDSEDQLQLLTDKIEETSILTDAEVYFDGFHHFTPMELQVIEALLKRCQTVTVALTIDKLEDSPVSELDLFYETKNTYDTLLNIARENDIQVDESIVMNPAFGRFKERDYFAHLEANFDVRPVPAFQGNVPIQIAEAVHPRAEIEGAAQEIIRLVREENYRFQDIVVFVRQMEGYHDLIDTIFRDYDIPIFIDEKKTMLNHSLIELIRSSLDIIEGNWRYAAIFRVLKTGFIPMENKDYPDCPLTNDAIDELENYVLEYGIRSRARWVNNETWKFERFHGFSQAAKTNDELETENRINAYRHQVVQAIYPLDKGIQAAKTIKAKLQVIYEWLEWLKVPKQLEEMRKVFDDSGQIEKGREQEQVWDAIIQLFDEMVEMAGNEEMALKTFRTTLDAGFETLNFAHVPPSMDHVIAGTVDRTRISGMKCVFLLGVNDGAWPMKPNADGMINEQERELLKAHGMKLSETSKRQLLDDWFYMYLAFTAASDKLWISFPLSDEEGKAKMPSQLINKMEEMFPACKTHVLLKDPEEILDADRFITTPSKTRAALTFQLARSRKGYPVMPVWYHVLNWYIEHQQKFGTTYQILQSLYYQNKPVNLTKETAEEVYPKQVKASVSRLEMYYRCSYQHFAKYTLKLEERKSYKLDAPDIGQLFHESLKKIMEWVQQENKDFASLDKKDAADYAHKAITALAPILQHQILHSSNRYKYIQKKLEDVIARAAYVLSEQAKQSKFSPVGLEIGFGEQHDQLDPVTLSLSNGFELMLRGRIDRVDKAQNKEELYLRIIDYKSSTKGLNLVDVYYGLALQMLAYLDVVLAQSENWLGIKATPAGVLYFHVHNPMLAVNNQIADDEIEQEIFKKYKMQGLLLSDEDIVRMMDTTLLSGTSQVIPAGVKKTGGFYSNSKIADQDTFHILRDHVHQLMKHAGLDMTEGSVHLNPYQYKQNIACTFCPFLSVCQFDPSLEENQYRKLPDMKDDEILKLLHKKGGNING